MKNAIPLTLILASFCCSPACKVDTAIVVPDFADVNYPYEDLVYSAWADISNWLILEDKTVYLICWVEKYEFCMWNQYTNKCATSCQIDAYSSRIASINGLAQNDCYGDEESIYRVHMEVWEDDDTEEGLLIYTKYGRPFKWCIEEPGEGDME
jgi:hypothetical protein